MVSLNGLNRLVSALEKRYGWGPLGRDTLPLGERIPTSTIIGNVEDPSLNNKVSRLTRHESSAMQVWEPQVSESHVPCEVQTEFFYMIYMDIMLNFSLRLPVPFHEGSYLSRLHAALIGRTSERNLEPSSKAMLLWKSEALETKVP
jgi:hypothetical protein